VQPLAQAGGLRWLGAIDFRIFNSSWRVVCMKQVDKDYIEQYSKEVAAFILQNNIDLSQVSLKDVMMT
jgi:hypothetical protein